MPFLIKNYGGFLKPKNASQKIESPLGTVTASDHHALISDDSFRSFLTQYYGNGKATDIKAAAGTFTTTDRHALVKLGDKPRLEDCYYRMLLPHEVKLGMAFDTDYIVLGNSKEQVKQLGNAVTPPVMKQILGRCIETLK